MNIEYEVVDCYKNLNEAIAVMKLVKTNELPIIRYDEDNFILGYNKDNLKKLTKLCKS